MTGIRWVVCLALAAGSAFGSPAREWLSAAASSPSHDAHVPEDLAEETQALRDQLDALKRESAERQALTVARGRAYVRLARAGLMPLTNGFEALAAHASRLERLRRALGRDLARERQVTARRLEMARSLQELDELNPTDRQAMVRARTAVLAAEERDQAFQRAFQSDWNPSRPATAVYGASVSQSYQPPAAGGFAAQRGRLPFPLAGRSEIQKLRSPSGSGKALLMLSTGGAMVRAVYPGRVAFADEYPNMGNTVILDHGGHYYTVSAHLQRIAVEVGEELSAGHRIGTVGIYDKKPALLFEVRDGKSTIDTPEWFGI